MDMAILSFVQFDEKGNVNVSVIGDDYFGCGGYIDICHGAKKLSLSDLLRRKVLM